MNHLDRYYRILGLEPGASLEAINQAYKDLAFVWHPDRIPKDNPRLLEKAVAKLQELNHAREQLRAMSRNQLELIYQRSPQSAPPRRTSAPPQQPSYYQTRRSYQPRRPSYADWIGANLQGANFKEKDLSGRDLTSADLSNADLSDSFLHKIILEKANLFRANLFRANLLQANLRNANLQEANLIGADFSGADLSEADLRGAKVGKGDRIMVKLTGVKLTGAILPDGTVHR